MKQLPSLEARPAKCRYSSCVQNHLEEGHQLPVWWREIAAEEEAVHQQWASLAPEVAPAAALSPQWPLLAILHQQRKTLVKPWQFPEETSFSSSNPLINPPRNRDHRSYKLNVRILWRVLPLIKLLMTGALLNLVPQSVWQRKVLKQDLKIEVKMYKLSSNSLR